MRVSRAQRRKRAQPPRLFTRLVVMREEGAVPDGAVLVAAQQRVDPPLLDVEVLQDVDVGLRAAARERHERVLDHALVLDVDHVARPVAVAAVRDVVEARGVRLRRAGPAVGRQEVRERAVVVEERDLLPRERVGARGAAAVRVEQAARDPARAVIGQVVGPDVALVEGPDPAVGLLQRGDAVHDLLHARREHRVRHPLQVRAGAHQEVARRRSLDPFIPSKTLRRRGGRLAGALVEEVEHVERAAHAEVRGAVLGKGRAEQARRVERDGERRGRLRRPRDGLRDRRVVARLQAREELASVGGAEGVGHAVLADAAGEHRVAALRAQVEGDALRAERQAARRALLGRRRVRDGREVRVERHAAGQRRKEAVERGGGGAAQEEGGGEEQQRRGGGGGRRGDHFRQVMSSKSGPRSAAQQESPRHLAAATLENSTSAEPRPLPLSFVVSENIRAGRRARAGTNCSRGASIRPPGRRCLRESHYKVFAAIGESATARRCHCLAPRDRPRRGKCCPALARPHATHATRANPLCAASRENVVRGRKRRR